MDSKAYLGVEAVLRKHVGTVLNFEYKAAHEDHLHLDSGTKTGFNADHRSRVPFVQRALSNLFGKQVRVDGEIGSETGGGSGGDVRPMNS